MPIPLIAVAKVVHQSGLDKAVQDAQLVGGAAAVLAVGAFLWARLRLDKGWAWFTRHMKEDQRLARQTELVEVLNSKQMTDVRAKDITDVFEAKVVPELCKINRRIDDHMEREEAAAAEANVYMRENTQHVREINQKVDAIGTEQTRVATELAKAQEKVDDVAVQLAIATDRSKTDAEVIQQHIKEDAVFQSKVEPLLTAGTSDGKKAV